MQKAYYEALDCEVEVIHEFKDPDGAVFYLVYNKERGIGQPYVAPSGNYVVEEIELVFE